MKLHATFTVYGSITDGDSIPRLRQIAGEMVQRVVGSGKAESVGIFPGIRGGYCVLNVDSAEELMELVGDAHEVFEVNWRPVVSPETLGDFFEKHPPE